MSINTAQTADRPVRSLLANLERTTGMPTQLKEVDIDFLADAVGRILGEFGGRTDEGRVVTLTSSAMSGLGDAADARRLLVFGSGLVRAALWEFSGGEPLWILDLRKLHAAGDASFELALFQSLDRVLDTVLDVWEGTSGRGQLGLRNIIPLASTLLPHGSAVRALAAEIVQHCGAHLRAAAAARGWKSVPDLVHLDAPIP